VREKDVSEGHSSALSSRTVACNLCGGREVSELEEDGEFRVVQCRQCGLVYVDPQPGEEGLFAHYDEAYFGPWQKEQAAARKKMWRRRITKIESFSKPAKLLDVGCGCSPFLQEARQRGWEVSGTEVSAYAARYARDVLGVDVYLGAFPQAGYPAGSFDVVTFWHTLEHATDPMAYLREALRVLKPGGIVFIAVPNIQNYIYKWVYQLVKRRPLRCFQRQDREIHLYHFSMKTLRQMLEKAGFIPIRFGVDAEQIPVLERFYSLLAEVFFKISGLNMGIAFEVCARKP